VADDGVEVLVLCGAAGTGKTSTLWEVGHVLRARGVPRALIDTDELDRVWPTPNTTEALISISRRNLRAVWETFASLGIRHLVLCGVMASTAQSREWIDDAIPGAAITFVRLSAERSTRADRLRAREVGSGFDQEMEARIKQLAISRLMMNLDCQSSLRIEGRSMRWPPMCSMPRTGLRNPFD
jgi:hypothetical protein